MERKSFLKSLSIFAASTPFVLSGCSKSDAISSTTDSTTDSTTTSSTEDTTCTVTPTETEGPFPTKSPSSYVRSDITKGDGVGASMSIKIIITNTNDSCNVLEGAIVDIWHCDVNGDYSEYGGTTMQTNNYQSYHWLRGRQTTDSTGVVSFTSIFPGWYESRATHVHVHVYNSSGKSLLVTQIAFSDDLCISVNTNGSSYGYTKGTSGYTKNASDNVFSDSVTYEIATVTGSLSAGFSMTKTINVSA
ncbi:dioxygenase family protein [Rhizosphaericola mali]|uniref:Intradiol ring-cleavage dioxygenase n=1 Tax=Rhizosphaericola mali TaxID=2545455 RepID=A0A5P2FXW1_9BACT|nr:intradiol ring-cleavage dioxygenase [Rhizosphaericola mali]QES87228.1 intradiol ring-cleavage dioxygenase [Rhizosphaericola mali]